MSKDKTDFTNKPFYNETVNLFKYVETHNFDKLADLCDDDFGIVDIDPTGKNVIISTREEWEAWFHKLFDTLTTMNAKTYTEILDYDALVDGNLGYGVVNFCQYLEHEGKTHKFYCVTTIIWKKINNKWKESRWHASVIRTES